VDLLPNERYGSPCAGTLGDDRDGRPGRTAQRDPRLVDGPILGGLPGDLDDAVARLDAGALGGGPRKWGHDDDPAVADIDLDANATVVPGRVLVQARQPLRTQKNRVRVVQLVEHAIDGFAVEVRRADRIHVVALDVRHDLVEQTRSTDAGSVVEPALEKPPTRHKRGAENSQDDKSARAHATPVDWTTAVDQG